MFARPHFKRRRFRHSTSGTTYTPPQLAKIYGFPAAATGKGQKVAVIELGGGFVQSELDGYFQSLGLHVAPVVEHGVDGASNSPGDDADAEVMLDLCVIGGMAPGVELHCYFAPNTDDGFLHAIQKAIADGMGGISISWGGSEDSWDASSIAKFEALFQAAARAGITVAAAAGDNGSGDGEPGQHVDYPASSAWVLGCGGTSLQSVTPINEVVWNDGTLGGATGGGISALFGLPAYQSKANVPGGKMRGVPDVAGNADPETGWLITVGGQQTVIGGTSAVAPMWIALIARINEALGHHVGLIHAALYGSTSWLRDIISGNNGTYNARLGYDCNTGMGVPIGERLLSLLRPPPAPVPPQPQPPAPQPPHPQPPAPPPAPPVPTATRQIVVQGQGLVVKVDGKTV